MPKPRPRQRGRISPTCSHARPGACRTAAGHGGGAQRLPSLLVSHVEPRYQPPPACPEGGVADISIKLSPGGEVVSASVRRSSGNAVATAPHFAALKRASPLPLPRDPVLAERLQRESFVFKFKVAE